MDSTPNSVRSSVKMDMKEWVKSLYLLIANTAFQFTYSGQKWQLEELEEEPSRQQRALAIYGTKSSYSLNVSIAFGGTGTSPLVLGNEIMINFPKKAGSSKRKAAL